MTSRLDRADEEYYLVVFGEPQAATGIAAVDVTSGKAMSWAALPGSGPHLAVDSATARERAGLGPGARARLVWKSCRGSRLPLYPIWEISDMTRTRYVDQQGGVWQSLEAGERGG